jgi:hypothetical protein
MKTAEYNELMCLIRKSLQELPCEVAPTDVIPIINFAANNWIGPVLLEAIEKSGCLGLLPQALCETLSEETRLWALKSGLRRVEIQRVLCAFEAAKINSLLLKGFPLGYLIYSAPYLRPCCDVDLFVKEADAEETDRVLKSLGYEQQEFSVSDMTPDTGQRTYELQSENGYWHRIDLHWRVSGYFLYEDLFSFDELFEDSVTVTQIHPGARTLALVHALILACTHRSISERNRLIWLCDIDRIARLLDVEQWTQFANIVRTKRVRAVCLHFLRQAQVWFGTPLIPTVVKDLEAKQFEPPEFSSLTIGRRPVDKLILDLMSINGWPARQRFANELLFGKKSQHVSDVAKASEHLDFDFQLRRIFTKCRKYLQTRSEWELSFSKYIGEVAHE